MKRKLAAMLTLGLLVGLGSLAAGCAPTAGSPYFHQTRQNQPHTFRNRIHNPADCRYAKGN